MKEANFQTLFGRWVEENYDDMVTSVAYELKLTKTNSILFSAVKEHQVEGLMAVKHSFLYHKISDAPIFGGMKSRFTKPKPFDCFVLSGQAYVCIMFYKPRRKKEFIMIDIDDWLKEVKTSTRKSLTEERAKQIGRVINLNQQ